ncbi:MAG TPA: AsmA family protein, partial [Geothrix sp.]
MPTPAFLSAFFHRWRVPILVLAGFYGLWLLVGFFLIPRVLKGRVERFAADFLHRQVTLQQIHFNPILLTARLEGLRVANRDGSDWITLRRLYLDYRFRRLISRTIDLAALELDGLTVRVELDDQGRPNFQDLLQASKAEQPASTAPSTRVFAIGRFQLRDGQFQFTDRSQ